MSKRRSIVSSFGDFTNSSEPKPRRSSSESTERRLSSAEKTRVGAGIIGATKRSLKELREERDKLLAAVTNGDQIVTLDPLLIDPSPFRDRLSDDDQDAFSALKQTLLDEGQKVPITVRRHPDNPERYQVVYGHRRTRALRELGLPVEAIQRDYSDRELVVAQGIENGSRQDLTWIERALFATTMERQGLKPRDIKAALSVDDAQLSKFRSVCGVLGSEIVELIGRAPKIGRPRWLELAALTGDKDRLECVRETLSADKVRKLTSDQRFIAALQAVSQPTSKTEKKVSKRLAMGNIGRIEFQDDGIKLMIDKKYASSFGEFLEEEMDGLVKRFKESKVTKGT